MVLPTSGTAICRLHSTVVLLCVAASIGHHELDAMVLCRCRGEQLQNTFTLSLHQFSRFAVCANLLMKRSHTPHRLTRTDLLAGVPHLGLEYGQQLTCLGFPLACG